MSDSGITLRLINRYSKPVRITALGSLADGNDPNGATKVYEWDLSAETWNAVDTVSLQVKYPSASEFSIVQTALTDLSVIGVVRALNTLNVGLFNQDGNTIYIPNDNIVYGDLSLRLGNIDVSDLKSQAYEFFVPSASVLRTKYPTYASWESEYGAGFDLLIANTSAATDIATYGMGVVLPVAGATSAQTGSISYIFSGAPTQPIFSTSAGTTQANSIAFSGVESDVWVYFPAVVNQYLTASTYSGILDGDIAYHDPTKFVLLSAYTWSLANNLVTMDNMFNGSILQFVTLSNSGALSAPAGYKFPSIGTTTASAMTINLDDAGIIPTTTFTNNNDFILLSQPTARIQQFVIEGKDNILFPNDIWDYASVPTSAQYFFQYNGTITLDSAFNTMFSTSAQAGGTFAFRFASNTVVFSDTTTPIEMGGFSLVNFSSCGLTAFPPINFINNRENSFPTFVEIFLNVTSNQLSTATVNQILIDLDNATAAQTVTGTCQISLQGQTPAAPPSGAGLTARTNLIARGFTVTTD